MEWLICAFAGILSGIIGGMGMGGGGVLIIYLNIFTDTPQTTAQGINLLFFLPTALFAVVYYSRKKLIEWKIAIPLSLTGIAGTLIGSYLCGKFDDTLLTKIFALLLLFMGIRGLFSKKT